MSTECSDGKYVAVYVTVPSQDAGRKVAAALLEEKLAACVNIVPAIESHYWWEGKIQADAESLLMIKTKAELLESLTEKVKEVHAYDVPEVIGVPILGGNAAYLKWIDANVKQSKE